MANNGWSFNGNYSFNPKAIKKFKSYHIFPLVLHIRAIILAWYVAIISVNVQLHYFLIQTITLITN